jgi:hypothetical protein
MKNHRASTTSEVLSTLDRKIASIVQNAAAAQTKAAEQERTVLAVLREVSEKQQANSRGGKAVTSSDRMDVDTENLMEGAKSRNRK